MTDVTTNIGWSASLSINAAASSTKNFAAAWLFGSAFVGLCWLSRWAGTSEVGMLLAS
jgi:hypothetical protein